MLPEAWERRLVDINVQPLKPSDIQWADVVFASAMIVQKDSLRRVVELCKAEGKRVVIGGPYVTTGAEHLLQADHIFLGEAETTLPEFVRDLERGAPKRIYQAAERPALFATPIPDFHLADLRRYSAVSVQYSRGCPFQCEICDIIEIYGRVPRTKRAHGNHPYGNGPFRFIVYENPSEIIDLKEHTRWHQKHQNCGEQRLVCRILP